MFKEEKEKQEGRSRRRSRSSKVGVRKGGREGETGTEPQVTWDVIRANSGLGWPEP